MNGVPDNASMQIVLLAFLGSLAAIKAEGQRSALSSARREDGLASRGKEHGWR